MRHEQRRPRDGGGPGRLAPGPHGPARLPPLFVIGVAAISWGSWRFRAPAE